MAKCVACGSKAKEKRIELDFCKICASNFDNRIQQIKVAQDKEALEKGYSKVISAIETRDKYDAENKKIVLDYFKSIYDEQMKKIDEAEQEKANSGLVCEIKGAIGRTLQVYENKVVIITNTTLGSVITGNATDGKKTIYFKDVIGLQFKPSGALLGFLQLETASPTMNNEKSNFYNENTFTFNETTTSNQEMLEIHDYIDRKLETLKGSKDFVSNADEIRKFKTLLDDQIITEEEFEQKKKQLLNL